MGETGCKGSYKKVINDCIYRAGEWRDQGWQLEVSGFFGGT